MFLAIALGLLTFGHATLVTNMISHATRDGARVAATWPNRLDCGVITNTTDLTDTVKNDIATVVGGTLAGTFSVTVTQSPTPNSPCSKPANPLVQVKVSGCIPYLFPIVPSALGINCNGSRGFAVNTTMVAIDEGV